MGTITVNTTPQAIYPDGLQDAFVLKNNGPYTIYVDSDTSVSTQSLAVPPTGVIAWDARRPLFVVCGDAYRDPPAASVTIDNSPIQSTVTIVRNSNAPIPYVNVDSNVIFNGVGNVPSGAWRSQALDCSAYQSIQMVLNSNDLTLPLGTAPVASWLVVLKWIDKDGRVLSYDEYRIPPQSEQTTFGTVVGAFSAPVTAAQLAAIRITTKVKGFAVVVSFRIASGAGNESFALNIRGLAIPVADKVVFTNYDTLPHMTPCATASAFNLLTLDSTGFSFDHGTAGSNYSDLILPCISPTLKVHLLCPALSNAPSYYFTDPWGTSQRHGPMTNPTADSETIIQGLPMGVPTRFRWNTIPQQAGPVNAVNAFLRFTWV